MLQSRSTKKLGSTLLLASLALAQDSPKTMNRITVQLDGSEVPENNFARNRRPSTEQVAPIVASKKPPIPSIIFAAS